MTDYSKGKIYKLTSPRCYESYIGSTVQKLNQRLSEHKYRAMNRPSPMHLHFNELGWNSVQIKLIELHPCNSSKELRAREQYWMDLLTPELNTDSAYTHCPHDRQHKLCKECKGSGICVHNKHKNMCKECGGSGICVHNKQKHTCGQCNGNKYKCNICDHVYAGKTSLARHMKTKKHLALVRANAM